MKLEAVIVCHNYSDFLAHTLPENLPHFDRLVVVTHPSDFKTLDVCSRFSVDVVKTTQMHDYGDVFNKARCIDLGLAHLVKDDWVLHIDADIVLPHNFRNLLKHARLVPGNLYGADRMDVYGYDCWMRNKEKCRPSFTRRFLVTAPREFTLSARLLHAELGYMPIGYFQLWHGSEHKRYPLNQGSAEHTDVLFAAQWAREQRQLLPEVICYHLESVERPGSMGTNWNGRRTPHFGPVGAAAPEARGYGPAKKA